MKESTDDEGGVVEPGKIVLTGFVREESNKTEAEETLKRVKGVKVIDNQIQVYYPSVGGE